MFSSFDDIFSTKMFFFKPCERFKRGHVSSGPCLCHHAVTKAGQSVLDSQFLPVVQHPVRGHSDCWLTHCRLAATSHLLCWLASSQLASSQLPLGTAFTVFTCVCTTKTSCLCIASSSLHYIDMVLAWAPGSPASLHAPISPSLASPSEPHTGSLSFSHLSRLFRLQFFMWCLTIQFVHCQGYLRYSPLLQLHPVLQIISRQSSWLSAQASSSSVIILCCRPGSATGCA